MKKFRFFKGESYLPTQPEYYNTDDFTFVGVTPLLYSPMNFDPIRYMLFEHNETGEVIKGQQINSTHPMWDYNQPVN